MFSQSFGNFILNKGYLTKEQVLQALSIERETHVKIGVLAVNSGKISADQVEKIHLAQQSTDKRFGEIAIEKGYINEKELDEMLSQQKGHVALMQAIIDLRFMDLKEIDKVFTQYTSENVITDGGDKILEDIIKEVVEDNDVHYNYLYLMIRNINRFLDSLVMIDKSDIKEMNLCVQQKITGDINLSTNLILDSEATKMVVEKFSIKGLDIDDNEIVQEFLNLVNGLYLVNLSNNGKECQMQAPITIDNAKGKAYTLNFGAGKIQVVLN